MRCTDELQWVQAISAAVSGAVPKGYVTNTTSTPLPNPQSPWPAATQTLVGLGAAYQWAIYALNRTNGDLLAAEKLLGLGG